MTTNLKTISLNDLKDLLSTISCSVGTKEQKEKAQKRY